MNKISIVFICLALQGCVKSPDDFRSSNTETNTNTNILVKKTPIEKNTPVQTRIQTPYSSDESLEFKLACLNKGYIVEKDDTTVSRFRYLLENIEKKTQNTKQQIGDMTVNSQNILRKNYGKEISLLELMEQTNKAIPDNTNKSFKYEEIISMVISLLKE